MMRPVLYDFEDTCPNPPSEEAPGQRDKAGVSPGRNDNRTAVFTQEACSSP